MLEGGNASQRVEALLERGKNTGDSLAGLLAVRSAAQNRPYVSCPFRMVVLGTDFYNSMVFMLLFIMCVSVCRYTHTRMSVYIYIIPMSCIKPVRHVVVSFPWV